MVAEVGESQVECFPNVNTGKAPEKCPAEKLTAKRAAVLARKHSRSLTKTQVKQNLIETTVPDDAASNKEKKKKKFVPAPWLCEDMTVVSTVPIRSDLDDAMAFIEGKAQAGSDSRYYDDSEPIDIDELELAMLCRTRLKKNMCLMHQVKNIPGLNYATKRKLEESIRKHGKRVVVESSVMSRLKAKDEEVTYNKERRNDNTSRMLNHHGMRRKSELEPKKAEQPSSTVKPKPNYTRTKRQRGLYDIRKRRWTQEQKDERVYIPHEFELVTQNMDHDDPEEVNLLCFLLDFQHRDMTPEDYEMLLRLDDKIAPKTIADDKLASLRTEIVSDPGTDGPDEGIRWEDTVCAVCMESYEKDQTVKFLPCEHYFHSNCIEMWLNNSGNTCPLDGLEV